MMYVFIQELLVYLLLECVCDCVVLDYDVHISTVHVIDV